MLAESGHTTFAAPPPVTAFMITHQLPPCWQDGYVF
jgi:hypothetical protein